MKKFLCININVILLFLFALSGCSENIEIAEDNIYNFINYQNEEVYDIEQIELSNSLSKSCISYKFTYISDG